MSFQVHVLHNGYSTLHDDGRKMTTNCTCTLIKGATNMIVDTMTPWDADKIVKGLFEHNLDCNDIKYVICTHGHSDHIGNNNLFKKAELHIVGLSVSYRDIYSVDAFEDEKQYDLDEHVTVIPTRGHTLSDVSVIVKTEDKGIVAITGDLFEREEDIDNPALWREIAGSEDPVKQTENRNKILLLADWIVPGHGPMFKVTQDMKRVARLRGDVRYHRIICD